MPEKQEKTDSSHSAEQETVAEMEPWENWETKLIGWSLIIGFVVLVIGGIVTQILL